jgi:uncharacterized NAD(P)/FAD-binding protein YdhS
LPPAPLRVPGADNARVIADPWHDGGRLAEIAPDDEVLLVGTGLTAIDLALTLTARGQRRPIVAISRHGLLPCVHGALAAVDRALVERAVSAILDGSGLASSLRALRDAVRAGADARAIVDGLRPHTPTLWRRLSRVERRRFLAHLRAYWDVHRHRLAPEIGDAVAKLVDEGRLVVRAGRLIGVRPIGGGRLLVDWRPRGVRRPAALRVDRVVNCTGPSSDLRAEAPPLLASLVAEGLARPCPLGLGLWVDSDERLVGREGQPHDRLRVVGALRRGEAWESTAIPELRAQAAAVAEALSARDAIRRTPEEPAPV